MRTDAKALAVFGLMALGIGLSATWAVVARVRGEAAAAISAAPAATPSVTLVDGHFVIEVDPQLQINSGIRTRTVKRVRVHPRTTGFATVMDLRPLIDFRARYLEALARKHSAAAAMEASGKEYERLHLLYRQDRNVPEKVVEAAAATAAANRAQVQAAVAKLDAVKLDFVHSWGAVLAARVEADHGAQLRRLLSGKAVLLEVTLPPDRPYAAMPPWIRLSGDGSADAQAAAQLVAPSPRVDPAIQGQTYFYIAARGALRTGMRVTAHLPVSRKSLSGVVIPDSALIWYADRPWVYVETDRTHFTRRTVSTATPVPGGWLVARGWRGGEKVVVAGAQLLLSQELKPPAGSADEGDDD